MKLIRKEYTLEEKIAMTKRDIINFVLGMDLGHFTLDEDSLNERRNAKVVFHLEGNKHCTWMIYSHAYLANDYRFWYQHFPIGCDFCTDDDSYNFIFSVGCILAQRDKCRYLGDMLCELAKMKNELNDTL